jgi:hypothetical protein
MNWTVGDRYRTESGVVGRITSVVTEKIHASLQLTFYIPDNPIGCKLVEYYYDFEGNPIGVVSPYGKLMHRMNDDASYRNET